MLISAVQLMKQMATIAGLCWDIAAEWHAKEEARLFFEIPKALGPGFLRQGREDAWTRLR